MAWIKFDKDLIDDPRILRAAEDLCERYIVSIEHVRGQGFSSGHDLEQKEHLSMMRNAVTGALVTLWVYADTHIRNGDVLPISVTAIDRMVGLEGFCELIGHEWVRPENDGQSVVLPGYCEKNGLVAKEKRKIANADRQRRFRDRKSNAVSNGVSNAQVTHTDLDLDKTKDLTPLSPLKKGAIVDKSENPKGNGRWWLTNESILEKANELGVNTYGETTEALKAAIHAELARLSHE